MPRRRVRKTCRIDPLIASTAEICLASARQVSAVDVITANSREIPRKIEEKEFPLRVVAVLVGLMLNPEERDFFFM